MATSDARPAFRLPWQSGHGSDTDADGTATAVAETPAWPSHDLARRQPPTTASTSSPASDGSATALPTGSSEEEAATAQEPGMTDTMTSTATGATAEMANPWGPKAAPSPIGETRARKPMKFLADLTRAMRAAADEARQQALVQFQADVTVHIDGAHRQAEAAAADARTRAEEEIAGLREWSKAEIARIKQETDDGIAKRRERLDAELADQNAGLELELERVQGRVHAFEGEMDAFFQRLAQEEDPAQFAAMAEQLPEPPAFDNWRPELTMAMTAPSATTGEASMDSSGATSSRTTDTAESAAETSVEAAAGQDAEPVTDAPDMTAMPVDAGETAEASSPVEEETASTDSFDAAEAEAAVEWAAVEAQAESTAASEAAPTADATSESSVNPATGVTRTQVAVVGLVSVASIATFKRLLSRAPGISAVQVASGPDGEFVFSATHDAGCDVAAAVSSLKDFEVQVTEATPGHVSAKAVDPEAQQ